jgi:hypothetical protein
LLEEAAREATAWVRFGGAAIDFAPAPVFPATPDSIERLDEARALDAGAATRLVPPGREALADCFTLVARRSGAPAAPIWTHCAEGAEHAGSIPARREMRWLDGRDARALLHVGERTRREMQEPSSLHAQSFPIGAAPLEPGDPVVVHFAAQGLLESPATVESARLVSASRVEIVARGPVAGGFCWVHDAQTYLRAMSAGRRLVLYIGGAAVLNLERIGDLRIAGRLREEAGFSAPTQAAPLAFSGGYVYLAVGSAPAFMRVDAQGDIDLNGTAREASLLEFAPTATCMEVDATRFSLAPTPGRGAFEFRASEGVLHLAGGVTEEIGV